MRTGFVVPHVGHAATTDALRLVAAEAVNAGAAALWAGDHFALAAEQETPYPYGGTAGPAGGRYRVPTDRIFLEAFTTLGYLAALRPDCPLGTSVAILPYRPHLHWAKLVGTIAYLTEGRFRWGVGEGWLKEEFDALRVGPFADRRPWTDDVVRFVRGVWDEDPRSASYHSAYADIKAMSVVPSGQEYRPEVWIGGNGPSALRRVARLGDTWHPHVRGLPPDAVANGRERIAELRREEYPDSPGRLPAPPVALFSPLRITEDRPAEPPWTAGRIDGPASYIADVLQEYEAAGVEEIVLSIGGSARTRLTTVETIASALS
ncbi:LLM class flavin-dependent oxidoreductase [Actinacidiphila sp. ITFR-21]|uniref:LLM class flavin-dependent oxidoreductase n=1 Tax=Actinacidiphila sp. ITFR-21 TaxID=3075199 RepID=UPI00288AB473|nr:LLM class flavin-dependent oxidoreductase [Streptomyces sp. ITFR-21]WNI14259.1 LLM class flavin-dependent oxidoreductase [Streptomyces sp. ITFR-21]